jgi:hypothetical protein
LRREGSDEDLPGVCLLLQPGGDVDDVARDQRLVPLVDGRHDLTRVDANPRFQGERRLLVQRGDGGLDRESGSDGAFGVVIVDAGYAEDGHRRVADELLDRPAVGLDDLADALEVHAEDAPDHLRIVVLAEGGRADDVGEQNGDELALFRHGRSLGSRFRGSKRSSMFRRLLTAGCARGPAVPVRLGGADGRPAVTIRGH